MKRLGALRVWAQAVVGSSVFVVCAGSCAAQKLRFPEGAQIFQANCVVCHQSKGVGLPGLAPPLTRNPGLYATVPEGRRHLAMMVLYGMFGQITVDGNPFNFKMPSFKALSDDDLAAVLDYVVFDIAQAPTSVSPLTAMDVAAERKIPMTGQAVREHRVELLKTLGL